MHKKSIVTSAIILTIASIITRLLGFVYRIYMSNIIGAEGMGLYQLIMPMYGLAWSIACSGFTTTVSKLTAQEKAKGETGNIRLVLKICVLATTILGIILGFTMFFASKHIAVLFIKDTRTILPLKVLAFAIPFMAMGSCFRGYFLGLQEALIPAINQVFEQVIRMLVIYMLAGVFVPLGLEFACIAALLGIVAEEFCSLIYVLIAYKKFKTKDIRSKKPNMSGAAAFSLILAMALPLTANRVTGSFLSTFENLLIPQCLQLFGYTPNQAISIFGQISGMAMPLIYFPSAFLTSLSISLVPAVSESIALKNYKRIQHTASKSMLFASVIGFIAAGLFIVFSSELGQIIYKQDISHMLLMLGIMCPFLYMQVILSGILNGMGYQVFLFRNSLLSSLVTIGAVYFFVPKYGISAFVFGWFASLIVTCSFELNKLQKNVELNFEFINWFLKPLLCTAASGLTIKYLTKVFIFKLFGPALGLTLAILIMVIVYIVFIVLTGCLSTDDLSNIFKSIKPRKAEIKTSSYIT